MKKTLLLLVLLPTFLTAVSQGTVTDSSIKYRSQIFQASINGTKSKIDPAYLISIGDSIITISSRPVPFNTQFSDTQSTKYVNLADIKSIHLSRKGRVQRGALTGFLIGCGIGVISGLALGSDKSPGMFSSSAGEKAMGLGLVGGFLGTLAGAIGGANSGKTFKIFGNKQKLKEMNLSLLEKLYIKPVNKESQFLMIK